MMINTSEIPALLAQKPVSRAEPHGRPRIWSRIALALVMLISLFMNFYQLGQNGFGNLFYASGVRSMADNLHNFFFVSYDPGGFVTIDKPPLGFWLQAISVKLFGFTPFSVFFPQALAGVLAVLVLYMLVRRHFGVVAGLLAALALAVSPLSVVTNRNNTIDSTLALAMLLGAWAMLRAVETGRWRWILLGAVSVGLGFNIKMLEAYLVVPAFGLLYVLTAPRKFWVRLVQLAVAVVVMLVISLSWAGIVDLVPASQRPYVGSSQDNSEVSLAIGYNGTQRLLGRTPGGLGGGTRPNANRSNNGSTFGRGFGRRGAGGAGGGGFAGGFGTGGPALNRLFLEPLGGQIAWLLPAALLAILALAWRRRPRWRENGEVQSLVLWGTWLLTMGIFFSVASFFHQYYMTVFAPAICALFGIGIVVMWRDYRSGNWRGCLLPVTLLLTALEQVQIILSNPSWGDWFIPFILLPTVLVAFVLALGLIIPWLRSHFRLLLPLVSLGLAALLLVPAYWSAVPGVENIVSDLPAAGQTQAGGRFAGFGGSSSVNTTLLQYLETHQGKSIYLVAVPSSSSADALILATNKPVMALGGFGGSDPILTTSGLQTLVAQGTVRFFLLNGGGFGGGFGGGQQSLTGWVEQACSTVASNLWNSGAGPSGSQLYDCASPTK